MDYESDVRDAVTLANVACCSAVNAVVLGMDRTTLLFNLDRMIAEVLRAQKALDKPAPVLASLALVADPFSMEAIARGLGHQPVKP